MQNLKEFSSPAKLFIVGAVLLVAGVVFFAWDAFGGAVWNKLLSRTDTIDQGLVGHWTFDAETVSGVTVTDRSGNGKNGTTSAISLGDGADGAVTITVAKNINTDTIAGGRSYADGIAYRVTAPADGATSVTRYSGSDTVSNGIAAGDEVLLINLQGAAGDTADTGNYEIMEVSSASASSITFSKAISKSFDGTTASNQKVVVQRIPNYTNVTLSSSGSLTASAWDSLATAPTGAAGYYTGVVVLKANGTVSVASGTSIHANAKGYQGGAVNTYQGKSYDGASGASTSANLGGGGGGAGGYGGDPPGKGGGGGGYGIAGSVSGGSSGGGAVYGAEKPARLFLGSGGGGGGGISDNGAQNGGVGGNGGGAVLVSADIISVAGGITANGAQGVGGGDTPSSNLDGGPGGGGSGGSVFLVGGGIALGSSITTATGAASTGGFNNLAQYASGAGGNGRISVEFRPSGSVSGVSSPVSYGGVSGPNPKSGKIGQALDFDGTDDYISVGNAYNGVKSVSFWIKADSTTKKILDLNGSAYVEVVSGTITATGWTSPTIYVDGAVSSTIDTQWHHVTITSATGINASAVDIGRVGSGYFDGAVDDVRFYSRVITADEANRVYHLGATTKINTTLNRSGTALENGIIGHWTFDGRDMSTTGITATGGTITTSGDYTIHTFTSSGTFTPNGSMNVEYLVVAGGGGGGQVIGGGGGAGGYLTATGFAVTAQAYTVTVGGGGAGAPTTNCPGDYGTGGGTSGSNSVFGSITATGGGGGGNYNHVSNGASTGGSGGGIGAASGASAMAGTSGQGNAGGISSANTNDGAGGGGAGAVGGNASSGAAGAGGAGLANSISSTSLFYAGGGGGGARNPNGGAGGAGGSSVGGAGGAGFVAGSSGTANRGGGGGGGGYDNTLTCAAGGNGGSGIVIIRYAATNLANDTSGAGKNGTLTGTTRKLGKIGQALSFDGVDDYISVGNVGSANTVSFWINTSSITQKVIDLNGTQYAELSSGTITATGFTSPTIYIDGAVSSTLTSGWHHVAITTGTTISASAVNIGKVTSYFSGTLDDVRIYNRALSASEILRLYQLSR